MSVTIEITPEQMAEAVEAAARAQAILVAVQDLDGEAAALAMTTALTACIEQTVPAAFRLSVLNKLLAETIQEWSLAAGRPVQATLQ